VHFLDDYCTLFGISSYLFFLDLILWWMLFFTLIRVSLESLDIDNQETNIDFNFELI